MIEYDEVELTVDHPEWNLRAGARGAVVGIVPGEDFVTVEFSGPNDENAVHLVPRTAFRVTDRSVVPASAMPARTGERLLVRWPLRQRRGLLPASASVLFEVRRAAGWIQLARNAGCPFAVQKKPLVVSVTSPFGQFERPSLYSRMTAPVPTEPYATPLYAGA